MAPSRVAYYMRRMLHSLPGFRDVIMRARHLQMKQTHRLVAATSVALAFLAIVTCMAAQPPASVKLVLVGRDGTRTTVGDLPPDAFSPRVSPDGRRLSFESLGAAWIADMQDLASRRAFKPANVPNVSFPVWQDSGRLIFIATQGRQSLYSAGTSQAQKADVLVDVARAPDGWSAAAGGTSFITLNGDDYDIWFHSAATKQVTPLVVISGSRQLSSQISPDGKWLAYKSDETGSFEIWVQPFPAGPRTRLTTAGGRNPRWSADGRELFFDDDFHINAMTIKTDGPLTFSTGQPLPIDGFVQAGSLRRQWDLTPDGRFVVMVR